MAPISKLLQEVPRWYSESLVLLSSSVPNSAFLAAKLPYYKYTGASIRVSVYRLPTNKNGAILQLTMLREASRP